MSEIKQINTGVAELLAVKVPKGAINFYVFIGILFYSSDLDKHSHDQDLFIEIPPGTWTPLY